MLTSRLRKSLPYYEQVYHSIKQMIFQGDLVPGERVFEAKLARDFNVSRSPVREAVRSLVKDGLLVIDGKSQITVYSPTLKDVEDIYQCRMALESLAARLTTEMATERELEEMEQTLLETASGLLDSKEIHRSRVIELNSRFHDLITDFSRNQRLQRQLEDLRALSYFCRVMNFQGRNRAQEILEDHRRIFQYIKLRDANQAAWAMEQHMMNDLNHLKAILSISTKGGEVN